VLYVLMVVAPLVLARRFARDPGWADLARAARAASWWAGGLIVLFATRLAVDWNGVWQRAATLGPAALLVVVAVRLGQSVAGSSSEAERTTDRSGGRAQRSSFVP
jgi:hypothetical protein